MSEQTLTRHRRWRGTLCRCTTVLAALIAPAAASRAASITLNNYTLQANKAGQTITISVAGSDQVAGEDFYAQIGDGGSINGGVNAHPTFQSVDILTGTIFAGNNTGATGDPNGTPPGSNAGHPLIWVDGTTTNSGTVTDNGTLATLTVDTTGAAPGVYPLLIKGVANNLGGFDTVLHAANGDPIPVTITNGTITVVAPEPTGLAVMALGGVALLGRRRRAARLRRA